MIQIKTSETGPTIWGPEPLTLEGRTGWRYWVYSPYAFTDNHEVDERLSAYPLVIFLPPGRKPEETPVVTGLQGMAAPFQFSGFLVPTLLDMGIACVLLDTPLAGERSLVRTFEAEIVGEIIPLVERGISIQTKLVLRIMEAMARDLRGAFNIAVEQHGLTDPRRALFGVSLGTLLSSFAFLRDGLGERLLGTIGHADLPRFAHSFTPATARWLAMLPARVLAQLGGWCFSRGLEASLQFVAVLNELARNSPALAAANPMSYADKAGQRPIRFLVGDADPVVNAADAQHCAEQFSNGACYVVPGMDHGRDGFPDHVRYFVETQLGDWRS